MHIFEVHNVDLKHKNITLVGKSILVGIPLSFLLLQKGAFVKFCDIHNNIQESVKDADIIISAAGVRNLIQGDFVKEGVIVIDAGCNKGIRKIDKRRVVGDVEFNKVSQKAKLINLVPGGVGPITVSMLIKNVVQCWKQNLQIEDQQKQDKL
ncbi:hypothetical protein IMG5_173280 [Ichthyophthirius multifiliis]|uniref:methenyltetrahydrofolate cyclohydrolase n=1 Tax=Ichthyophthirius multifiliis TaxID=5932 RepID=G0R1W5_ICHMU|nr:hypothetical protein IMG5_173280 [Ichthyophthirius multifiliis]EGR28538.1 hypothetical protein IMG5_173280 [Ichthyophthirius multifiliis]|eukprot:XP_004029774.1 hypothetical protein IMG5_173280 [Ichthyophthirius multifiliis]